MSDSGDLKFTVPKFTDTFLPVCLGRFMQMYGFLAGNQVLFHADV